MKLKLKRETIITTNIDRFCKTLIEDNFVCIYKYKPNRHILYEIMITNNKIKEANKNTWGL